MGEIVLDVHDSVFMFELKCDFDVLNPSMMELLEQEVSFYPFTKKYIRSVTG